MTDFLVSSCAVLYHIGLVYSFVDIVVVYLKVHERTSNVTIDNSRLGFKHNLSSAKPRLEVP